MLTIIDQAAKYTAVAKSYIANASADGKTSATIGNISRVLRFYGEFCASQGLDPFTGASVAAWKAHLASGKGDKASTIRVYLTVLGSFFDYGIGIGASRENPVAPTLRPRRAKGNAPYQNLLTAGEIEKLLSPVRPDGATRRTWARNYAIVTIFLTSAIRNSELRDITPLDLDWRNNVIAIRHGKGDKFRYVQFPKVAQRAVQAYLESGIRPQSLPDTAPLFGRIYNGQWQKLDRVELSETVSRHVKIVTGCEGVRSHALRHSSSSYMWDHGMSADDISGVLGHSNLKTTQIYLDRLHPAAPAAAGASIFDAKFA